MCTPIPFALGDAQRSVVKGVERIHGAVHGWFDLVQASLGPTPLGGSMRLTSRMLTHAETNLSTSLVFVQSLMAAKSAEDVLTLQTRYVQAQVQAFYVQLAELRDTALTSVTAPFGPPPDGPASER